tara:strand:+ start:42 stop:236 length:195 start_codon:yes stop_codon:yes gene_type:complete
MIDLDMFIYGLLFMVAVGGYMTFRHGYTKYNDGFLDAVQLHSEGRLTYKIEKDNTISLFIDDDD